MFVFLFFYTRSTHLVYSLSPNAKPFARRPDEQEVAIHIRSPNTEAGEECGKETLAMGMVHAVLWERSDSQQAAPVGIFG